MVLPGISRAVPPLLRRHLPFFFYNELGISAERRAHTISTLRSNTLANPSKTNADSTNTDRSWLGALSFSIIAVAVVLTVAVIANLAIGRVIHWDIVAVLGTIGFIFLTVGRKFKSI